MRCRRKRGSSSRSSWRSSASWSSRSRCAPTARARCWRACSSCRRLPEERAMTKEQIEIVQSTFGRVRNDADGVAALFYGRLFEIAPDVRPMFRGDMTAQGRKLMSALALAVDSLTRLESLIPALESLGRKHVHYGVLDRHYDVVGEALLWTLKQGLGLAWTPEAKDAWATTYGIVASVMQKAAAQEAAA